MVELAVEDDVFSLGKRPDRAQAFVGVSGVGAGIKSKQVFVPSVQPIVAEPRRLVGWSLESKTRGILGALRIDRRREPGGKGPVLYTRPRSTPGECREAGLLLSSCNIAP